MAKQYIEREVLLDFLRNTYDVPLGEWMARNYWSKVVEIKQKFISCIEKIPAADVVEVRHGVWNEEKYPFCNVCMNCGLVIDRTCIKYNSGKLNFCPNCGVRMDGEMKEEKR